MTILASGSPPFPINSSPYLTSFLILFAICCVVFNFCSGIVVFNIFAGALCISAARTLEEEVYTESLS